MNNIKTEGQQDMPIAERFKFKKQHSENQFQFHSHLLHSQRPFEQQQLHSNYQHILLPHLQLPTEKLDQGREQLVQLMPATTRLEYIKLPEIDEKFFIKNTIKPQPFLNQNSKQKSHSHQPSKMEINFSPDTYVENGSQMGSQRKVEFNQQVQIIDYINNASKISGIDGSSKPVRQLRRNQTRFISDELTKIPEELIKRNSHNYNRPSVLLHFFEDNKKLSNSQRSVMLGNNLEPDEVLMNQE